MRCGRRLIKSKNRDKKREGDAHRESCGNVFGVCCDSNGVRRVQFNASRLQIETRTQPRKKEREEGQ
jgi:hypothetical protein